MTGCAPVQTQPVGPEPGPAGPPVGSELSMVSLPTYRIEPPDILEINAVRVIPKSPYRIEALDYLAINAYGGGLSGPSAMLLNSQPIIGTYGVEPGGTVSLGPAYGRVHVAGMTLEEASGAITQQLSRSRIGAKVSVTLVSSSGLQQIQGEHRVGLDGTVNLGEYGEVYVTGLTTEEARAKIEQHLTAYLEDPEVAVDVFNYASKKYWIIGDGGPQGDSITPIQITGNETVLQAIASINGLSRIESKKIWIARPTPDGCFQRLYVDWTGITKRGESKTNYQIMPGDRIFVSADKLIAFNAFLDKVLNPVERMFSFASLGSLSVEEIKHPAEFAR
jgi:polysaccharide export outer membrane protein